MQEHAFEENLAVVISLPVLELAFLAFDWENAKNLDSGFVHIFWDIHMNKLFRVALSNEFSL